MPSLSAPLSHPHPARAPPPSTRLEDECTLCPTPAPAAPTAGVRASKSRFCAACQAEAAALSPAQLSRRKLAALRRKQRARGLCARYRCAAPPVQGRTYCAPCARYQNAAVGKCRRKKAAAAAAAAAREAGGGPAGGAAGGRRAGAAAPVEVRRITIASLLND